MKIKLNTAESVGMPRKQNLGFTVTKSHERKSERPQLVLNSHRKKPEKEQQIKGNRGKEIINTRPEMKQKTEWQQRKSMSPKEFFKKTHKTAQPLARSRQRKKERRYKLPG